MRARTSRTALVLGAVVTLSVAVPAGFASASPPPRSDCASGVHR
jgi:hypothetical protein